MTLSGVGETPEKRVSTEMMSEENALVATDSSISSLLILLLMGDMGLFEWRGNEMDDIDGADDGGNIKVMLEGPPIDALAP